MTNRIALLRGINVSGHRKILMADLRQLCESLGWKQVNTYIQSGNVVFQSGLDGVTLEDSLERDIKAHYGFEVPVIVRSAEQWQSICAENPFPGASGNEPNRVMVGLARRVMPPSLATEIQARAAHSERVKQVGEALWIHFPDGAGNSKISPALLDRLAGSPVTSRNCRTANRLLGMLGGRPEADERVKNNRG